jgi:hypothetical protein
MSYIEKKFFKEGQNETSNQIDIFKNKSTGDLMFRDPLGEEILITPQGGLAPIINNLPTGPAYKVYTALLTQSGGSNGQTIGLPPLTIGVTYTILSASPNDDWTNVGAPNNEIGTSFVATGTTPNYFDGGELEYNTGAPVVTVLENTIGNIWFTYTSPGIYSVNSNNLFIENKTTIDIDTFGQDGNAAGEAFISTNTLFIPSNFNILTTKGSNSDNILLKNRLEIRVYN